MPEWTIQIESPPHTAHEEEHLERFADALLKDVRAAGPAASMNTETGQLAATFQVDASLRDEAAFEACLVYWSALGDAGVRALGDSSVAVTLADDPDAETTTFNARPTIEVA